MDIIILGFPHCGTSILKSIIGHCESVKEILYETDKITKDDRNNEYKHHLCKTPYSNEKYFGEEYQKFHKIMILRNPIYVYSSLNNRFSNNIPQRLSFHHYLKALSLYDKISKTDHNDTSLLLYKNLFLNNFQAIKNVLNAIGIKYNNEIFNNSKYDNFISKKFMNLKQIKSQPDPKQHDKYRTYQINLPFVNMNDPAKINLTNTQKRVILEDALVNQYFPENQNII